jgi:hypothetical protein
VIRDYRSGRCVSFVIMVLVTVLGLFVMVSEKKTCVSDR